MVKIGCRGCRKEKKEGAYTLYTPIGHTFFKSGKRYKREIECKECLKVRMCYGCPTKRMLHTT